MLARLLKELRRELTGPRWRLLGLHDGRGADFVLWNLVHWLQDWIGEDVDGLRMAVVIGDEERIRANRAHYQRRSGDFATAGAYRYPVGVLNTQPFRRALVDLYPGAGGHLKKEWRAARLVAGEIMIHDAARREHHRVFVVRLFGGW